MKLLCFVNLCHLITSFSGYAGRTELPDNLKSMFRPISMVVPDSGYIAEIILFGEGFSNTRVSHVGFIGISTLDIKHECVYAFGQVDL